MWHSLLMLSLMCFVSYLFSKLTSNEPNKIKFHAKYLFFYFYSLFIAGIIWPYFLLKPKDPSNSRFAVTYFSKHITYLYDLRYDLRNGEILKEDRGAVVISNHQSAFDILGLFQIWNVAYNMTVIAKKELFYFWPFGLAASLAGVIFIDRSNTKSAYKTIQTASRVMVHNKTKIWIFPEGTRNKDYTKFLPFKKGAFVMAVTQQVPIIPVVFSPYYFINKERHIFDRGHIVIQCLDPVPTKGLTLEDVPELISSIHEKMFATYKELTKEIVTNLPANYPFTTKG